MDPVTRLQHLEYLESGFEVSKQLAHAGYRMNAPALVVTWGQVAEAIAQTLSDYGIPPDRLDEGIFTEIAQFYINEGNMQPGGKLRTIRASASSKASSRKRLLALFWGGLIERYAVLSRPRHKHD